MTWGKPAPLFGGDIFDPTGPLGPYATPPIAPIQAAVNANPHRGFFAEGGTGRTIAGFLGDALLRMSGGQPIYAPMMMQRQQQALAEANRQRQNEDSRANFTFEQEYRAAHPQPQAPDEFDRTLQAGGVLPGTPAWVAAHRSRADNMASPMTAVDVQQPDGSTVRQWMRPPASGGAPVPIPVTTPGWTPIEGGAGSQAPRPFPRRH